MDNASVPMFVPLGVADKVAEQPEVDFIVLALAGFAAQLVDGGLGMGYGLTPGLQEHAKPRVSRP